MYFMTKYDAKIFEIQDSYVHYLKRYIPISMANIESIGLAFGVSRDKAELIREYNLPPDFGPIFEEDFRKEREQLSSTIQFFSMPLMGLFWIGLILSLGYLVVGIYKSFKTKHFSKTEFARALQVGFVLWLLFAIFSYRNSTDSLARSKRQEQISDIEDSYQTAYAGLIRLSNEFYDLYLKDQANQTLSSAWYGSVEYIRKETVTLKQKASELKSREAREKLGSICDGILRWGDLATSSATNSNDLSRTFGEASAELRLVLNQLSEFNFQAYREAGAFSRYLLPQFDGQAKATYESIQQASADSKHSIYLLFGYELYSGIYTMQEKPRTR